jgi:hypothetical protein
MRDPFKRALTFSSLLIGTTALGGCQGAQTEPASPLSAPTIPQARADTGLELRIFLRRDTITRDDRRPVEVVYFVVNGPRPTRFNNDPSRYSFRIERADGQMVPPVRFTPPILRSLGSQVSFVLPAGALFGQVQDLRCIQDNPYATTAVPSNHCLAEYALDVPGRYHVIVQYDGPPPNLDSLLTDTGVIDLEVPVPEGRRLVDTATLVVVRR